MKNKRLLIPVIFLFLFSNAYSQCGQISLIGEFNGWAGDHFMEQDSLNPDLYSTIIFLAQEDDMSIPPDGIIEMKFLKDASWEFNWGNTNFPTGVAPFPGASTGTGGRIRDNEATGRGSGRAGRAGAGPVRR